MWDYERSRGSYKITGEQQLEYSSSGWPFAAPKGRNRPVQDGIDELGHRQNRRSSRFIDDVGRSREYILQIRKVPIHQPIKGLQDIPVCWNYFPVDLERCGREPNLAAHQSLHLLVDDEILAPAGLSAPGGDVPLIPLAGREIPTRDSSDHCGEAVNMGGDHALVCQSRVEASLASHADNYVPWYTSQGSTVRRCRLRGETIRHCASFPLTSVPGS